MMESARIQIGPYEITREIGRGGMGVVYLARDTKLDRDVAIKCLPDELSDDADRLARFEREAKLLASLNHPNIATIHGLEEVDGKRYLILEYVKGKTLEEKLSAGAVPVDEALLIALQIAEAMEAAHEKGVIHRDLKPANIKFTNSGGGGGGEQVKVLDFGLAKALVDETSTASELAKSPTIIAGGSPTLPGVVLGTAGYLSPEQARGRPVDKRSDIFAFGCILYEMLTGITTFGGETVADSIGATLHKDPVWESLPSDTPPTIQLLLRRCLNKDRKRRLHDISDARLEIDEAISDPTPSSLLLTGLHESEARGAGVTRTWLASLVVVFIITAVATWLSVRGGANGNPASHRVVEFEIPLPPLEKTDGKQLSPIDVVVAPDGSAVVIGIAGVTHPLYIRELNSLDARPLIGTEGAHNMFFSPDGRWIGYTQSGQLMRIPRVGGTPLQIMELRGVGNLFLWLEDGSIIFNYIDEQRNLFQTDLAGSEPVIFFDVDVIPELLGIGTICRVPGRDTLLLGGYTGNALDAHMIISVSLDGTNARPLVTKASRPFVTRDGHLIFLRESSLYAMAIDLDRLEVAGSEVKVLEGVTAEPWGGHGAFDFVPNGVLAYIPGQRQSTDRTLTWVDRDGAKEPVPIKADDYHASMKISPDGTQIAFNTLRQRLELWIYDMPRAIHQNLRTDGEAYDIAWSPDGQRLAYSRLRPKIGYENSDIMIFDLRAGSTQQLPLERGSYAPYSWLPDGNGLLYTHYTRTTEPHRAADLLLYRFGEKEGFETVLETSHNERKPALSHNGQWLAYWSTETGRHEVFLRTFPDDGRKWQVSFTGMERIGDIRWAPDDREIYWVAEDHMMAATIETNQELTIGVPQKLFASPWPLAEDRWKAFDVGPDGRFIMIQPADWENRIRNVRVIMNWSELLKKRISSENE